MNKYDIIGDIHGCARTLEGLLKKLGYFPDDKDVYRHKDRQVIFLGDFIDGGPYQREAIAIVRKMIEAGAAKSVMGNHEYNAIAFAEFLRPHSEKNIKQHVEFLNAYVDRKYDPDIDFNKWYETIHLNPDYQSDIEWFKTLPLWLEQDGFRVIHACWDKNIIKKIGKPELTSQFLKASSREGTWEYEAIETILKGKEIPLPDDHSFKDKDGNVRHNIRVRWWGQGANSYRQAFLGPESARTHIPDDEIEGDHLIEYGHHEPPVFLGHYWMEGEPVLLAQNIACTDFSVAKVGGKLIAYCWSGESKLCKNNFTSHDRIE